MCYKNWFKRLATIVFPTLMLGMFPSSPSFAQVGESKGPYAKLWNKADSLMGKSLPKSALEIVDQIYADAVKKKIEGERIRAVIYRSVLSASFAEEGDKLKEQIFKDEIKKSKDPVAKALLESMLGEVYYRYFYTNIRSVSERTHIVDDTETDFILWDKERLLNEAAMLYKSSLIPKQKLQSTPVYEYNAVLLKAKGSEKYRPTMFDILAHRAIEFFSDKRVYTGNNRSLQKILTESLLGDNLSFIKEQPNIEGSSEFAAYALNIYMELTLFHMSDKEAEALIELTLSRLEYAHELCANLPNRDTLYITALSDLAKQYRGSQLYPWIFYKTAKFWYDKGNYEPEELDENNRWFRKKAADICREALENGEGREGVSDCKSLLDQIVQQQLELEVQEVVLPDEPILYLTSFKNIQEVHYRIVRVSEQFLEKSSDLSEEDMIARLLKNKPVHQWSTKTGDPGDYNNHSFEYAIPKIENTGRYVLIASGKGSFQTKENDLAWAHFQVSRIAYISRTASEEITLVVTNRKTGAPLQGVLVEAWTEEYDYKKRKRVEIPFGTYTSNSDGTVKIAANKKEKGYSYIYFDFFGPDNDTLTENSTYIRYGYDVDKEPKNTYSTHFFFDRKIYRPGQIVHFKGIMVETSGNEKKSAVGRSSVVNLTDVNGQNVGKLEVKTNDFGSFHGSFVIPQTGLTGSMSVWNESGRATFRVEEYKRPKFEVKLQPVKGVYKPGDQIVMEGSAEAFAGYKLTGSKVTYTITREKDWFYGYYRGYYPGWEQQVIEAGETIIDENGLFKIVFKAEKDPLEASDPNTVFKFVVTADVTDLNGETHSADQAVRVGEKTFALDCSLPQEIKGGAEYKFHVIATNLNGETTSASGEWKLFKKPRQLKYFKSRMWSDPDIFVMSKEEFEQLFPQYAYSKPNTEEGLLIGSGSFVAGKENNIDISKLLSNATGEYYLLIEGTASDGTKEKMEHHFIMFDPASTVAPVNSMLWVKQLDKKPEPGEIATILVGSSAMSYVRYTVEYNGKVLEEKWITLNNEQKSLPFKVLEQHRGGVSFHLATVNDNKFYSKTIFVEVPFSNKELDISFATFRDKLLPGEEEEYRITISGQGGDKVLAELMAGMYDASLDMFASNSWNFKLFHQYRPHLKWNESAFSSAESYYASYHDTPVRKYRNQQFDRLNWYGYVDGIRYSKAGMRTTQFELSTPLIAKDQEEEIFYMVNPDTVQVLEDDTEINNNVEIAPAPPRTNFNETAFFFPQLYTDSEGKVVFSYKIPEALTSWKLLCLAHTPDLKVGGVVKNVVTKKELMVVPNPPRFFRENDKLSFSAKVTNLSEKTQNCTVTLTLSNALTGNNIDSKCNNLTTTKEVEVVPGQSAPVFWEISVPEGEGAITYRVTAVAGTFSDGEEMAIPVLSNRMLVTESLPLHIVGKQTKEFTFDKLASAKKSNTLRHHKLTLEYSSNPAWYAIQSLPYLMEYPYECSEQVFARYFANTLASYIANSDPAIKRVFDSWKNLSPDALRSNLEKNSELKGLILAETPWLIEGTSETDRKQKLALLFDLNMMASQKANALNQIKDQQAPNGGWPWFKGGPDNRYITQHITIGIFRLENKGVINLANEPELRNMLKRSVAYLDSRFEEYYENLKKTYSNKPTELQKDHLDQLAVQYFYLRSGIKDRYPLPKNVSEAWKWVNNQVVKYWTNQGIMTQGYIALALKYGGKDNIAQNIIASLKERSITDKEAGMYWAANNGYYWYEAPIERQALMIEAFDEVAGDKEAVEMMKVWLLNQKQTTNWKTTKATAEACYALLMRGNNLLADTKNADIKVGKEKIGTDREGYAAPEAGTGYIKVSWNSNEIKPNMADVAVTSHNDVVSWGAVYWQYFEQLDKITPHNTPLSLKKQLFVEETTANGTTMRALTDGSEVKVGDRIVVKVVLQVGRYMEYIHLKDMRASALEPESTLSGYRREQGTWYYMSPRDASMNFFFDYLAKGTYTFEYILRTTHSGDFSNGITTVQSMYAPEFAAHSEGVRIKIK